MKHSIIIPHRDRLAHLEGCILSVVRSMEVHRMAYEVIVVDNGTPPPLLGQDGVVRIIVDESPMPIFNKSRLLNIGIEAATGDVISILDADAIVGIDWAVSASMAPLFSKVCHRVWRTDGARAFEGYGRPDHNRPDNGRGEWFEGMVHGNSQFSIARERLGGLRYDESYAGRGFEDLAFNWAFWAKEGSRYHARIDYRPGCCMTHRLHPPTPGWDDDGTHDLERYLADTDRYLRLLRAGGVEVGP